MADPIDPGHQEKRSLLRLIGPLVLVAGLVLVVIALVDFFSAFGGSEPPRYFWCGFVGLPLMWLGFVLSSAGFAGAVQRYLAGESAPVAKDTANYLARETKEGIQTVAAAVGEGLAAGRREGSSNFIVCPQCRQANEPDACFCKACGAALAGARRCPACSRPNAAEATFCSHCGARLSA